MNPQDPTDLKVLQYKLFNHQRLMDDEVASLPEVVRVLSVLNDNQTDRLRAFTVMVEGKVLYNPKDKTWWKVEISEEGLPVLLRANKPK